MTVSAPMRSALDSVDETYTLSPDGGKLPRPGFDRLRPELQRGEHGWLVRVALAD